MSRFQQMKPRDSNVKRFVGDLLISAVSIVSWVTSLSSTRKSRLVPTFPVVCAEFVKYISFEKMLDVNGVRKVRKLPKHFFHVRINQLLCYLFDDISSSAWKIIVSKPFP